MIKIYMNTSVLLCNSIIICFVELTQSHGCSCFVVRLGPWSSVPRLVICMDRVSRSFVKIVHLVKFMQFPLDFECCHLNLNEFFFPT